MTVPRSIPGLAGRKVLVTGAGGFVGSQVYSLALAHGAMVRGLTRRDADGQVACDICNGPQVEMAVQDFAPEVVIHLAGSGVWQPASLAGLLQTNAVGTENIMAACARLKSPPRVVVVGSGFEFASQIRPIRPDDPIAPFSSYGVSKAAAANIARLFSDRLPVAVVRLFNVYGPGEPARRLLPFVVERTCAGEPVPTTLADQIRDFVHVRDVAEALLRVSTSLTGTNGWVAYNLGSGKPVKLRDFITLVCDELVSHGLSPNVEFGAMPYRPNEPMHYCADVTDLSGAVRWTPSIPLQEGIKETVRLFLSAQKAKDRYESV